MATVIIFPMDRPLTRVSLSAPDTLVEIGSCTKTFTTTLFALAINRKQIDRQRLGAKIHARGISS